MTHAVTTFLPGSLIMKSPGPVREIQGFFNTRYTARYGYTSLFRIHPSSYNPPAGGACTSVYAWATKGEGQVYKSLIPFVKGEKEDAKKLHVNGNLWWLSFLLVFEVWVYSFLRHSTTQLILWEASIEAIDNGTREAPSAGVLCSMEILDRLVDHTIDSTASAWARWWCTRNPSHC